MAKASAIEPALRELKAIQEEPEKFDLHRELGPFLRHKSNHVMAAAAGVIRRLESPGLAQELTDAFGRLMEDPGRRDPGCKALIAIAEALAAQDEPAAKVYFTGIRHVQMEGSFGPPVDAAAPLRGLCAQGLARMLHPDALEECVTLLADPEIPARIGAIRAIGDSGRPEGLLLLRLKVLLGDREEEVVAQCLAALLRLGQAQSVGFVAKLLHSTSEGIAERAALVLGESRLPPAFAALHEAWQETSRAGLRRTLLLAMAMLRQDEALEFLLARVENEGERTAGDALAALSLYSRDEAVRERVRKIVHARPELQAVFAREFGQL